MSLEPRPPVWMKAHLTTQQFPSQIGPCPFSDVAMYRNLLASLFGKAYPVTRGRDERELGAGNSAGGDSTQLVSHLRRV